MKMIITLSIFGSLCNILANIKATNIFQIITDDTLAPLEKKLIFTAIMAENVINKNHSPPNYNFY